MKTIRIQEFTGAEFTFFLRRWLVLQPTSKICLCIIKLNVSWGKATCYHYDEGSKCLVNEAWCAVMMD